MTESNIDRLVKSYVACRDSLAKHSKAFKAEETRHKAAMQTIADQIQALADAQGVESFKTPHGTAFKKVKDWVKVTNWDATLDYILANDLHHMLTKNVGKAPVLEYKEEHGELPPGLEYGYQIEIGVRRK